MLKRFKNKYIFLLEKYLCKASYKKINLSNLSIETIDSINSIKNHIIDLNENNLLNVNRNSWFDSFKNQYRLYSSIYRYAKTKEIIEKYIDINKNEIVDFGAGNGVFLEFLKLKGIGIDINKKSVGNVD